jgi:hypothetical protein
LLRGFSITYGTIPEGYVPTAFEKSSPLKNIKVKLKSKKQLTILKTNKIQEAIGSIKNYQNVHLQNYPLSICTSYSPSQNLFEKVSLIKKKLGFFRLYLRMKMSYELIFVTTSYGGGGGGKFPGICGGAQGEKNF